MRRAWSVFVKSLREQWRDPLGLSLSVAFAPVFVLLYYMLFPSGSTTVGVLVLDMDPGPGISAAGSELAAALRDVRYASGNPMLVVTTGKDRAEAERHLRDRETDAVLALPPDFSQAVQSGMQQKASVTFIGDLTNPRYSIASTISNAVLQEYAQAAAGQTAIIEVKEETLGASATRTEFETYIPGLFVFAVIMIIFQSAMTVTREIEAGTLRRLQLSRMTAFDFLLGISGAQALIAMTSFGLTYLVALSLGFTSLGPWWVALLVTILASLSVIGTGLIVACFSKTVTQAFLIANFPLGLFMFFSGSVFPMPRITLFSLFGHPIGPFELLPPTHAVTALNKVFTLGANLGDVWFELAALAILSGLYFAVGVWLFNRKQLR